MTTNETLFFRDVTPFENLQKELIPKLVERAAGRRPVRFWSAACSSGQEAYSFGHDVARNGTRAVSNRTSRH